MCSEFWIGLKNNQHVDQCIVGEHEVLTDEFLVFDGQHGRSVAQGQNLVNPRPAGLADAIGTFTPSKPMLC